MDKEEEIAKAFYNYTNRGWPTYTPWEHLMPGAKHIWKERAMRQYLKDKEQSS